jgi:hypothetical protein
LTFANCVSLPSSLVGLCGDGLALCSPTFVQQLRPNT